jgi:hypothetical protein
MRSGHDSRNICSVFKYMHALPHMVAMAGKVLADYPNPQNLIFVPRLVFQT